MHRFLLTSICAAALMMQARAEQPNLIYIVLDDAGYGDLSCCGQSKFTTPNFDRLATEEIGHCFVCGNREVKTEGQSPMTADIVKMPRPLKSAGYTTGMFGEWGLAPLKELEIDDNTLVMLSSENGPHKEGGHQPDFFDSNGPLRGYKRDLYEGGIRVPMLARWPGKLKAESTSDLISAHWDMLPTFCELAGAATPQRRDGISIVPTMFGHADDQVRHEALYWEFSERGRSQAVRVGKWKHVGVDLKQNPEAPLALYDLSNDIGEEHNIADQHPEVVSKLKAVMTRGHIESESFPLF